MTSIPIDLEHSDFFRNESHLSWSHFDIDEDFADVEDPVWNGMPKADFVRFAIFVRSCADWIGLRDWFLFLSWSPVPVNEEALASVEATYGRKYASIHLARDFAKRDPDEQKRCLIHELLHLHIDPLVCVLERHLPRLVGEPVSETIMAYHMREVEHLTDRLADSFAKYLPDLPPAEDEAPTDSGG